MRPSLFHTSAKAGQQYFLLKGENRGKKCWESYSCTPEAQSLQCEQYVPKRKVLSSVEWSAVALSGGCAQKLGQIELE
jgi:hypothetical protein